MADVWKAKVTVSLLKCVYGACMEDGACAEMCGYYAEKEVVEPILIGSRDAWVDIRPSKRQEAINRAGRRCYKFGQDMGMHKVEAFWWSKWLEEMLGELEDSEWEKHVAEKWSRITFDNI